MKCRYILFSFLFVFSIQTYSQEFKKQFSLGINNGLVASKISYLPTIKQNYLLGYNGGITARLISEKNIGLQMELNYSQRGWDEVLDNGSFSRTLNYIEFPFLTHIYFGKKYRFILNLGPKISYLLNESSNSDLLVLNEKEQTSEIKHKFDYGICAGTGVEFHTTRINYIIEGRYYYGLADIFLNGKQSDFSRSSNQNISINFILLYNIVK